MTVIALVLFLLGLIVGGVYIGSIYNRPVTGGLTAVLIIATLFLIYLWAIAAIFI